uniref:Prolactin-7A2 n=1 Tax=Rattus norvegicus TaxID=10116 RepID=PR7A2_RAT|nr:RecName: Full=Prolactin-7A2; AltName: Full=Placental prolactin-like protein F; Short=PLP-F; Short=PRL-like protein F; Flags: Precursor [Rattus norvegicus]AAD52848.1 prolactin-like protein F [Rattus norvegicus]|eukprot:NP_071975.1 prolactin-7A2 precursor [Rattus norvegicus]
MQLSFSRPRPWTLLLMVVSNLLLWENVSSGNLNSNETDGDLLLHRGLFDTATRLSQDIRDLDIEFLRMYAVNEVSEKLYNKHMLEFIEDMDFVVKALTCCHNYSIKTPENLDEAQQIPFNDFPWLILSRMWGWNETSKNLLTILRSIPGMHDDVISLAQAIERKLAELFEYTQSILTLIFGPTENVDRSIFSGLEDLKASDEELRFFALCKFSYCLRVDLQTIELYFKLLQCAVNVNSNVCLSINSEDSS